MFLIKSPPFDACISFDAIDSIMELHTHAFPFLCWPNILQSFYTSFEKYLFTFIVNHAFSSVVTTLMLGLFEQA